MVVGVGVEWLVDAHGCDAAILRDVSTLRATLEHVISELDLHVIGEGTFHHFDGPGGVTALYLLTESHLACHTYPELRVATFNLYCCRPRTEWFWERELTARLGAGRVVVRREPRGGTS